MRNLVAETKKRKHTKKKDMHSIIYIYGYASIAKKNGNIFLSAIKQFSSFSAFIHY